MPLPVLLLTVGILCLVSGVLVLILPETLSRILPDSTADVENMTGDCGNKNSNKNDGVNTENDIKEDLTERQILRKKLFSEDWVDAGNGILVNFSENKNTG